MKHNCKMLFLDLIAILALVSLPTPSAGQGDNTALPATIPVRVINNQQAVCPPGQTARGDTVQDIQNAIRNTVIPTLCRSAQTQATPAASCSALPTSCSSGYYWIRSSNGTAVQVYCDMNRVCGCSSTGGWTRVANLNTSDTSQQCPGAWRLQTYSSEPPLRVCAGRDYICVSATYSSYGISYSQVCGRVIGYQHAYTDALAATMQTIEGPYLNGVSLTHGPAGARQHIWTFAAGIVETGTNTNSANSCPCANNAAALASVPSFVGNDYFCESGNPGPSLPFQLFASDPLWDGQGCGSPPCCELSYPPGVTAPWFCKQLPQTTTDDLEVRICNDGDHEDVPVELVELYIR